MGYQYAMEDVGGHGLLTLSEFGLFSNERINGHGNAHNGMTVNVR